MNVKPKVLRKQTLQEVTCVYCSFCNFYQFPEYSLNDFTMDFKEYWNKLPSTLRLTPERRNYMINNLIGNQGFSQDVLKMMLRYYGQNFVEMGNVPQNRFAEFVLNINNGFIAIQVIKPFRFQHCLSVKNGYLMDSIKGKICLWKGELPQYPKFEFISALDCDQATDDQLKKNVENATQVFIDLT